MTCLHPILDFSQKQGISGELSPSACSFISFYYHVQRESAASGAHTHLTQHTHSGLESGEGIG